MNEPQSQIMAQVEALFSERDRVAEAVSVGHQRALEVGDERLREHVEQEVRTLTVALQAADELERERDALISARAEERHLASKVQMEELQHQVDRRLETQLRERTDTERHLEQQVGAARIHADERTGALQERLSLYLEENRRAVEMAEREREKAAQVLAVSLGRSIQEGDERLREHIAQQVQQIEGALDAARRETQFATDAQKEAIQKADVAIEKRFEGLNNFRAELSDRWAQTMPREVAEAQLAEMKKAMDAIHRRLDVQQGGETVRERAQETATGWRLAVAGFAVTFIVTIVVIVSNIVV